MTGMISFGVVSTRDWIIAPDGRQYRLFAGQVQVLDAKATLGITPGQRDDSWYAKVTSLREDDESVYLPGCQVAGVFQQGGRPYTLREGEVWR